MKTYKLIILLIFSLITFFSGCNKEDNIVEQDSFGTIKTPALKANSYTSIIATRKDAAVEIAVNYFDPAWYKVATYGVLPDYYELYLSKNTPDNFQMISTIDTSYINKSFTIIGLTNNELYYVYLKEVTAGGKETKNSNVAVFVPSAFEPSYNFILKEYHGHDLYSFDWNWSNRIVYATHFYEYSPGHAAESIFISESDTPELVDINCWSPEFNNYGTMITYSSDKGEVFDGKIIPEHLMTYDLASKKISRLTSGYSVNRYPVWSPDNSLIAFSSSENGDYNLRLKLINLANHEIMELPAGNGADQSILGYSQEHPAWSADGEYIYYTHRNYTNDNINPGYFDIYRMKSNGGVPEPVFDFDGIECAPAVSPDNSKIAFLSDLSGKLQIWVYSFTDNRFYQTFNNSNYDFSEYWSEIKWKDNKTLFFTAFSSEEAENSLFTITVE